MITLALLLVSTSVGFASAWMVINKNLPGGAQLMALVDSWRGSAPTDDQPIQIETTPGAPAPSVDRGGETEEVASDDALGSVLERLKARPADRSPLFASSGPRSSEGYASDSPAENGAGSLAALKLEPASAPAPSLQTSLGTPDLPEQLVADNSGPLLRYDGIGARDDDPAATEPDGLPGQLVSADRNGAEIAAATIGGSPPRVFIHYNSENPRAFGRALDIAQTIEKDDFVVADLRETGAQISEANVRYFYGSDLAAARRLRSLLGSEPKVADLIDEPRLLNLDHFRPLPREGTIELWLATQ